MNVLECSSRGDKRFSALYAEVEVFGKMTTVEKAYQACKRNADGTTVMKGKKVSHIVIGAKPLNPAWLTAWYKLLWFKYFLNNPELLEYAKQFDDYHDMFRGRAVNCQADVIKEMCSYPTLNDWLANQKQCLQLIQILRG